jgi:hypothetical protein
MRSYGAVYAALQSLGFRVVGADFYSHVLELDGRTPPGWRSYCRTPKTSWPTEETAQEWRNIANAGFKRKDGLLWDTASRIGHQLRVCDRRLRDVSEAYYNQLQAKVRVGDFKVGARFEDGFTWLVYLALQSFLVDACILRDYLAEFAAEYIYKRVLGVKDLKVTGMAGLKKKVLDKLSDPDAFASTIKTAVGDGGWLNILGNYRDLIIHSAPLAQARAKLFARCEELKVPEGVLMPMLRCPIPDSPGAILSARSTRDHFADFEEQFDAFAKAGAGGTPTIDGMDYASEVLGRLSILAKEIGERSPVAGEMIVFDKSNIIGDVRTMNAR